MLKIGLRGNGGYHLATQWYLGWSPLDYQYIFHHVPIGNVTAIAGVGAGKTTMVAASNVIDCVSLPFFLALNASVTAKQAELAFEMVDTWRANNSRLDRLIVDITLRPYPLITFWNGSTYSFRTAGQGAKFIRGHEYDRINYDEPGLDTDGEAVRVLRGRLRGVRADGAQRMARLDCTGTPTASVWLRERFEKGLIGGPKATPETLKQYFSMRMSTYDNKHLSAEQISLMEAEYPPELIDVELKGFFPDYGLSMFPLGHVQACVDASMNDEIDEALRPERGNPKKGYVYEEWPRVGIVHFETPPSPNGLYIVAGDPGTDIPPRRNSPCIGVLDIAKRPFRLVYFSWISGQGSYRPFLAEYMNVAEKYAVVNKAIDATGPQKAIDELGFENFGLVEDGLNFGTLKDGMLNSLLMSITSHNIRYPMIQGLLHQLSIYKREEDKKIAQDIVMMMAMLCYMARGSSPEHRAIGGSGPNYRNRRMRTTRSFGRQS
jgi:hypothetical protein